MIYRHHVYIQPQAQWLFMKLFTCYLQPFITDVKNFSSCKLLLFYYSQWIHMGLKKRWMYPNVPQTTAIMAYDECSEISVIPNYFWRTLQKKTWDTKFQSSNLNKHVSRQKDPCHSMNTDCRIHNAHIQKRIHGILFPTPKPLRDEVIQNVFISQCLAEIQA